MEKDRDSKGHFIKGHTPKHKGGILTVEHRRKLSDAKKGKPPWNKGKKDTFKHTEKWKQESSQRLKGHKVSIETRRRISEANSGARNGQWKDGRSEKNHKARHTYEYRLWRNAVLERDKACIWCGSKERLEADHIKPFASYPELRLAIDNGRILCHDCHKTTTTYRKNSK